MKFFSLKVFKRAIIVILVVQVIAFVFIKQRFAQLERKNSKAENEIAFLMNENNLLKIKLTTIQNQYRVRKLVLQYLPNYKPFKPKQVIEIKDI